MNPIILFFHKTGSPPWFYNFAGKLIPWFWAIFLVLTVVGLYLGLFRAPPDYQQGESVRIMYLHVPAAWMSMMVFGMMAVMGFIALVWHIRIMEILMISSAPVGAAFTVIALITGSLWGRPTWGTYWVWDARLTSELVLLFLYFGVIALYNAFDEPRKAARAASLMAVVGVVNLPIIHYSVLWWNTLHQGATISKFEKPSMDPSMLIALLIMIAAVTLFCTAIMMYRLRNEILSREHSKNWVREVVGL